MISNFMTEAENIDIDEYDQKDLFKEALVNLMVGNCYKPSNELLFWNKLMGGELDNHLWFNVNLYLF